MLNILLQATQPSWWHDGSQVIAIITAFFGALGAFFVLILPAYLQFRAGLLKLQQDNKELHKQTTEANKTAAVAEAKVESLKNERDSSKQVSHDRLLQLEGQVSQINRDLPPKKEGP